MVGRHDRLQFSLGCGGHTSGRCRDRLSRAHRLDHDRWLDRAAAIRTEDEANGDELMRPILGWRIHGSQDGNTAMAQFFHWRLQQPKMLIQLALTGTKNARRGLFKKRVVYRYTRPHGEFAAPQRRSDCRPAARCAAITSLAYHRRARAL